MRSWRRGTRDLGGQQSECLAHDADAHAQSHAELDRFEPLAGRETSIEDVDAQLVVDVDGETLAARSLDHHHIISLPPESILFDSWRAARGPQ